MTLLIRTKAPPHTQTDTQTLTHRTRWSFLCGNGSDFQDEGPIILSLPPPRCLVAVTWAAWHMDTDPLILHSAPLMFPLMIHSMSSNTVYQSRYLRWLGNAHWHWLIADSLQAYELYSMYYTRKKAIFSQQCRKQEMDRGSVSKIHSTHWKNQWSMPIRQIIPSKLWVHILIAVYT